MLTKSRICMKSMKLNSPKLNLFSQLILFSIFLFNIMLDYFYMYVMSNSKNVIFPRYFFLNSNNIIALFKFFHKTLTVKKK